MALVMTIGGQALGGTTVRLEAPEDLPYLDLVGWESRQHVILWSFDDYGDERASRLVRCSVDDGSCEGVPGGPGAGSRASM